MSAIRRWRLVLLAIAPLLCGCLFVPKTQINEAQSENRVLAEQNRAQLTEIGNLREHAKTLEDRVMRTEEELALYHEQNGRDRRRLAQYEEERAALHRK